MLPYTNNQPVTRFETDIRVAIPLLVADKLRSPPIGVGIRPGGMVWTRMPKAAVDEDRNFLPRKDDVDAASLVEVDRSLEPVTKTPGE